MTNRPEPLPQHPFQRGQTVDHSLAYMGSVMTVLARAGETGGHCSVLVLHAQRGSEPPPHRHHHENELFFVLDGELEVFCEGVPRSLNARPGELILVPQRRAHALNCRSDHIRMLIILQSPGGRCSTETYFDAMAGGRPERMRLPEGAVHDESADEATLARAHRLAIENGIELLSPVEAARLLPEAPAHLGRGDGRTAMPHAEAARTGSARLQQGKGAAAVLSRILGMLGQDRHAGDDA